MFELQNHRELENHTDLTIASFHIYIPYSFSRNGLLGDSWVLWDRFHQLASSIEKPLVSFSGTKLAAIHVVLTECRILGFCVA